MPAHVTAVALAIVAAASLVLMPAWTPSVEAASCNGANHKPPTLITGTASPGSGRPTTTIRFSVRYRDATGCAPTRIQVVISGVGTFNLSGGTSYKAGVTFSVGRRLPAGRWAYHFTASSGSGTGARSVTLNAVSPSRVVISKPQPKPTPKPAPKPTPRPTAKPAAKPKPKPTPKASPAPAAPSSPSSDPGGSPVVGAIATGGSGPDGTEGPGGGAAAPGAPVAAGDPADPPQGAGASLAGPAFDLGSLNAIQVWWMTSALGVLLFAIALRRFAPGDPAPAGSRSWRSFRSTPSTTGVAPTVDGKSTAAHTTQTVASQELREPIRFADPPRKGVVRSTVAYRLVRVTDGPDDHESKEIARLDRGDEVEVIGDREGFLMVRTPTGLEGWVPRMVLVG